MIYVSFLAHVKIASLIVSYRSLIVMVALLSGCFVDDLFIRLALRHVHRAVISRASVPVIRRMRRLHAILSVHYLCHGCVIRVGTGLNQRRNADVLTRVQCQQYVHESVFRVHKISRLQIMILERVVVVFTIFGDLLL